MLLDAYIHVKAARAAGFRPTEKVHIFEKRLHLERDTTHIVPIDAGTWIEIDTQLIGMLEIAGTNGMRMKFDASQIRDPCEPGRIVDDDFFRRATGRKGQRHRP